MIKIQRPIRASSLDKKPEGVLVLWDAYSPTVEARAMGDLLKLTAILPPGTTVYADPSCGDTAAFGRMMKRLGFAFSTSFKPDDITGVIRYFSDTPPDVPDGIWNASRFDRPLKAPEAHMRMHRPVQPTPDPPVPHNDPFPRFRSKVPQGTPSTGNLPWWAWTNNVEYV